MNCRLCCQIDKGNYNTRLLSHVDEIRPDRVVFSIDYPYNDVSDEENWRDSILAEAVGVQAAYEAIG